MRQIPRAVCHGYWDSMPSQIISQEKKNSHCFVYLIDFRLPEIMYNILHRKVGSTQVDISAEPFRKKHPVFPEPIYIRRRKELAALTKSWETAMAKLHASPNKCPLILYVIASNEPFKTPIADFSYIDLMVEPLIINFLVSTLQSIVFIANHLQLSTIIR